MRTVNTVPASAVESTSMVPPCAWVIFLAINSPRPMLVLGRIAANGGNVPANLLD